MWVSKQQCITADSFNLRDTKALSEKLLQSAYEINTTVHA
jgi:hypothetical protein